jgi:hypothetical protein
MKIIRNATILILLLFSLLQLCSCGLLVGADEMRITNVRIYYKTPVWELAKAVKYQNIRKIERFAKKHPELLDYQDPIYQTTLLFWAVGMERYEAAEALLKAGADPDIISGYEGSTALY